MKKALLHTLTVLLTIFVFGAAYLWLIFASPFGYHPTEDLPEIEEGTTYSVFVYGTLTQPWVRWLVMGRAGEGEPAKLPGFRRDELDLKPAAGAMTEGQVITVNAGELKALDRYERLGVRYERVKLTLQNGSSAWAYRLMEPLP